VIEVLPEFEVSGQAVLWNGDVGVRGATVGVEPSVLGAAAGVLERSLGGVPNSPRAVRAAVGGPSGDFAFQAEAGKHDFFVRPPDGANLAWFVTPGLELEERTSLGELQLPLPVRLEGGVQLLFPPTTSGAPLAHAHLRAYALLNQYGELESTLSAAHAAVPVAEGRLDAGGRYVLNVPASLNPARNP
jgi:hypothetical protein